MHLRTSAVLEAAFSLALAACREKTTAVAPPTPPSTLTQVSGSGANATVTAPSANAEPTSTVIEPPDERRMGQACAGAIVSALHPGAPVDYLELRLDYYPQRTHEIVIAGHTGMPCATAKDVAACTRALAYAKSPDSGEYLVYTRGDTVGTVTGRAAAGFLAPIDTAEEAALAVVYDYRAGRSAAEVYPPCEAANFSQTKTGFQTVYTQTMLCDERRSWTLAIDRAGKISSGDASYTPPQPNCQRPFLGRRPEGFVLSAQHETLTLGSYFSDCASMETASIFAFRRLESELHALGAPRSLLLRAKRSAREEARHARVMRRLATRFGEVPRTVAVVPLAVRTPLPVALENAVEGCVLETWAALLCAFQAERAGDLRIRAALRQIAREELRHAALAWDVAAWLDTRLTRTERARVGHARAAALEALRQSLSHEPVAELRIFAGVPSAAEATVLFASWRTLFEPRAA